MLTRVTKNNALSKETFQIFQNNFYRNHFQIQLCGKLKNFVINCIINFPKNTILDNYYYGDTN